MNEYYLGLAVGFFIGLTLVYAVDHYYIGKIRELNNTNLNKANRKGFDTSDVNRWRDN